MQQGYYKYDNRALAFKYGSPKHKFYDYLIRKENFSRMKGLQIGQVEITVRTVAKDIEVSEMVARRLIKQFIEDDFIRLVFKPEKGSKKPSIYMLKTYEENNTDNNTDSKDERTQKNENITEFKHHEEHRNNADNNTVNNTSKKEYIKRINKNNIYASQCDELWSIYPNKKGKAKAYKKIPKLLEKYSLEELKRCIERYSKEVEGKDKQYIKHGDTFFNSGYEDYLDENYILSEDKNEDPVSKSVPVIKRTYKYED